MRNASVQTCLVITFILVLTQIVSATPITVERSFGSNDGRGILLNYPGASAWTFDLRPQGFDPDAHDIVSATLTLVLSDWTGHGGEHGAPEYASLTAAGHWYGQWEVQNARHSKPFALNGSLDYLSDYGTLPVTLQATRGNFTFYSARLVVDAELQPQPSSVPVPGSMALLGLGLAGCVSRRSRLKRALQRPGCMTAAEAV